MNMNILYLFYIFFIQLNLAQVKQIETPLEARVSCKKNEIKQGDTFKLKLHLKNVSDRKISFLLQRRKILGERRSPLNITTTLKSENGEILCQSNLIQRWSQGYNERGKDFLILRRKEEIKLSFNPLISIIDCPLEAKNGLLAGRYRIQVTLILIEKESNNLPKIISSNDLEIVVLK